MECTGERGRALFRKQRRRLPGSLPMGHPKLGQKQPGCPPVARAAVSDRRQHPGLWRSELAAAISSEKTAREGFPELLRRLAQSSTGSNVLSFLNHLRLAGDEVRSEGFSHGSKFTMGFNHKKDHSAMQNAVLRRSFAILFAFCDFCLPGRAHV